MLTARPRSLFSWDYEVLDGDRLLATLSLGWFREAGEVVIAGRPCRMGREGLVSGLFFLEQDGQPLATAEKPSAFLRRFEVAVGGDAYTLRSVSPIARRFVLEQGGVEVGSLRSAAFFTRKMVVDLPETIPLPARLFLVWLVMVLWKRAAQSN
jgi:hypothetical protein